MGFLPSSAAASIYLFEPPYAIGSVPSLSGHAIAYRWRSLPRVRQHRASKPQRSSKRVLPWQVTMDQLICASLSHIHYSWYGMGMLQVLGRHSSFIFLQITLNFKVCSFLSSGNRRYFKHAHFVPIVNGEKRGAHSSVHGDAKAAPVTRTTFEDYWPCACGLSAVNAIGTQVRDPINSGLTRWRMAV